MTITHHALSDYYADYYGHDEDVLEPAGEEVGGATDAAFQDDPEYYWFSCLSEEEAWNFLDMQVKATAKEIKVQTSPPLPATPLPSCLSLSPGGPTSGEGSVALSEVG